MIASKTSDETCTQTPDDLRRRAPDDRSETDLFADAAGQFQRLRAFGKFYLESTADLLKAQARAAVVKAIRYAFLGVVALALLSTGVVFLAIAASELLMHRFAWTAAAAHGSVGGAIVLVFALGLFIALAAGTAKHKKRIREKYDGLYRQQRNELRTDVTEMAQRGEAVAQKGA